MSAIWQVVAAGLGATGIFTLIFTSIVTRLMNRQYAKQDRREQLRNENQLLMMARMDNQSEMIHLMAKKLHDAGIINGDLEELDVKYKDLEGKYNVHMQKLALEVLGK